MIDRDIVRGALLGTAVGDALGMPVEGLSHQNVRTYYKGIKEFRADEKRGDLEAGQWTDDTQFTIALAEALTEAEDIGELRDAVEHFVEKLVALRASPRRWGKTSTGAIDALADGTPWQKAGVPDRPTNGAAMRAAPLGLWWATTDLPFTEAVDRLLPLCSCTHKDPVAISGALGQAYAVRGAALSEPSSFDPENFWSELIEAVASIERITGEKKQLTSSRLKTLTDHLDEYPLDLQERCDGTSSIVHESWPFSVAMFVRNPRLVEATLLSSVNVGGDADTVGAMVGALLGAFNGWSAFPQEWRQQLENTAELQQTADEFYERLAYSAGHVGKK